MELIRNAVDRQGRACGLPPGTWRRQRVPRQNRGTDRPAIPRTHPAAATAWRGARVWHERQNHHHAHGGKHAGIVGIEGIHQSDRIEFHPRRGLVVAGRSLARRQTGRRHRRTGTRRSVRGAFRQTSATRLLPAAQRDARPARPFRRNRQYRTTAEQSRRSNHRNRGAQS